MQGTSYYSPLFFSRVIPDSHCTVWPISKFAPTSLKLLRIFCFQNQLEKDTSLKMSWSTTVLSTGLAQSQTATFFFFFFYFCCTPQSDITFPNQQFYRRPSRESSLDTVLTLSTGLGQSIPGAEFCRSASLAEAIHLCSSLLAGGKKKKKKKESKPLKPKQYF